MKGYTRWQVWTFEKSTALIMLAQSPSLSNIPALFVAAMPKDTVKDIQTLLRDHGLSLRMKDGRLSLEENAGAGTGLPRKARPIYVYVGSKPGGTPGRGEPEGYNLQDKTRMNDDDYSLVYDDTKTVLERTHGIDMRRAITLQNPRAVDLAVQRLVGIHPELEAFAQHGYWAPRAFIQMVLRNKSCKANTQARRAPALEGPQAGAGTQQAGAAAQQEAKPATKPPRKRGRPRKVKAPALEGQPAIEGVPTVVAQPVPQGEPALNGALVAAAQPVPAVIDQPVSAAAGQPVPAAASQPVPAAASQPIPAAASQPVPATAGQPIPAVIVQPAPAVVARPTPAVVIQPALAVVVQPVPELPHGNNGDVETIDLEIDESDFDVTMASAAHDLSRMSIHAEQVGDEPGDIIEGNVPRYLH
ncbi:hypothetical protein FRC10_004995, partial [Ceratobasidium sp. 414]